jgi:predicted tellurium resistance membrane protein TerC
LPPISFGGLLQKHRWMAYVGLAIILYVAGEMIYRGVLELAPVIASPGSGVEEPFRFSAIRSDG